MGLLNDDRLGRALDHLRRADRASLLTALVLHAVRAFDIDRSEFHLQRVQARLEGLQAPGRRRPPRTPREAREAAGRIAAAEQVQGLLRVAVERVVEVSHRQVGPGRPGPDTEYRRVETWHYRARFEEGGAAPAREARGDGLFPLVTNGEGLDLAEALAKYKYQPFVEKRHEQLKSVFGVAPVWLKNAGRIESLLWLNYVVELVQALLEREVRRRMMAGRIASLALYPEGRPGEAPTAAVVVAVLEGHRRHRLLDGAGLELRRFHDDLPAAAREVLESLEMTLAPYRLD